MQAINLLFSNVLHFQKISHLFQMTSYHWFVWYQLQPDKKAEIYYHRNKSMVSKVATLMEWYLLNHWDQWFFYGFSVSQPLMTMFFIKDDCCTEMFRGNGDSKVSSTNQQMDQRTGIGARDTLTHSDPTLAPQFFFKFINPSTMHCKPFASLIEIQVSHEKF